MQNVVFLVMDSFSVRVMRKAGDGFWRQKNRALARGGLCCTVYERFAVDAPDELRACVGCGLRTDGI